MSKPDNHIARKEFDRAAAVLKQGGLVAFPTETYYGLAVDPFNEKALERLFRVKKRSQLKPVLLLISKPAQLDILIEAVPRQYPALMKHFWPGPLTLIFPAKKNLLELVTGKTPTVGVRQSPHPVAKELLLSFGGPLTATSANLSGSEAAVCAAEVDSFFGAAVDLILDGGKTPGGKGSTLVTCEEGNLKCIREGCIPFQDIKNHLRNGN